MMPPAECKNAAHNYSLELTKSTGRAILSSHCCEVQYDNLQVRALSRVRAACMCGKTRSSLPPLPRISPKSTDSISVVDKVA